jgi:hypothetical protein
VAFEPSSIPAAIDGLVDLCQGMEVDGIPVEIIDGPAGAHNQPTTQCVLIIGGYIQIDQGGMFVLRGGQKFVTLPGNERDEWYDIFVTAISRSGDADIRAERRRAFEVMSEVEKRIRPHQPGSDHTLGGAVLWSQIGNNITYEPVISDFGAVVRVSFEVSCRARLEG